MMTLAVLAIVRSRNLFAVVVLGGIYSFLMATVLVALDAVDVAMTEAAVGAGVSTRANLLIHVRSRPKATAKGK